MRGLRAGARGQLRLPGRRGGHHSAAEHDEGGRKQRSQGDGVRMIMMMMISVSEHTDISGLQSRQSSLQRGN